MTQRIIFITIISVLLIFTVSCGYEFSVGPWEDGIIPYFLTGEFSDKDIQNISIAMRSWENTCGVKFIEVAPSSGAYEIIRVSEMEWSSTIGENNSECHMIFGRDYSDVDVIIHELGHCIGLIHEHQRPDRNDYVTIMWDNVLSGKEYNFRIMDNPLIVEQDFDYDYHSIMHYSPKSFSFNGEDTIVAMGDYEIYPAEGITELDMLKAQEIYGPPLDEDDIHE